MFNRNRHRLIALALLLAATSQSAVAQVRTNPADSAWTWRDSSSRGPTARTLLDGYVREAVARNLGLAQQSLAERRSEYGVKEANARFLPSVGLNARYTEFSGVVNIGDFINPTYQTLNQILGEERFPTNISTTLPQRQETKLALTQPIYNAALRANRQRAQALNGMTESQRRIATRQLVADIQLAWLNYASSVQVVRSLRATLPLLEENLRVSERLVANGQTTADAVHRSRAERSELLQQIAEASQRETAALRAFNLIRDRDADAPVSVADDSSLIETESVDLAFATTIALKDREELDAAEQGIQMANAEHRMAGSAWKPAVTLAADYGVQGDRYQFDKKHDVATASLVVSWNAFNGGQDAARRSQASIARDEATLVRRQTEQRIRLQVATAYDALSAARTSLTAANDRIEAARRTFTLVERRYAEGLAPPVEYVAARSALTNASVNQIITRYSFAARVVEFERAAAIRALPSN